MRYGPQDWDLIPVIWQPGADPRVWRHKACGERLEFPDDRHRCPQDRVAPDENSDMSVIQRERTMDDTYPLDMTCGTCHCDRRWHFKTHDGQTAGCVRKIGISNPIPCHCLGFMATESPALRSAYEAEHGRLLFRAALSRQNAVDGPKYRATLA